MLSQADPSLIHFNGLDITTLEFHRIDQSKVTVLAGKVKPHELTTG
jgi:hypothetical protein